MEHNLPIMKHIYFVIFIFFGFTCIAQDVIEYKGEKINALDENHQPTGIWKLYDDENHLMIVTEFENGVFIAPTEYYKDDKLIGTYNYEDGFEIYKDGITYNADFYKNPDGSRKLIDSEGNDLDIEVAKYFSLSSQMVAMYYGGQTEMYRFIGDNIDYTAIKNNTGKVIVKFVIDGVGKTSEIEIIDSTNPILNDEVKRLIRYLPRWQPGYQAGAFVKVTYSIPITIN